jgi:hypothetical protein
MGMASTSMHSSVPEVPVTRPTTTSRPEGIDPSYERELVRQAASTRRAIVLGSLTVILLGALVAAMLGMLPRWAPIVAAVPVVAFVIAAAMTSSQRSASKATSKTAPQRSATTAPRRERPARAESKAAAAAAADRSSATAQSDEDWENWNAWDDDESWDAVPTTLPTYVTAPRASAIPRGIDRSRPGEWTGSAMVETAQAMRARPQADALRDSAELIDHGADTAEIPVVPDSYGARRAVNE